MGRGENEFDDPIEYPLDGVLDLHQFQPADAKQVVADYLDACRDRGVMEVRIIHGKGAGTLCQIVHSVLRGRVDVVSYKLASDGSGWGATLVVLASPG